MSSIRKTNEEIKQIHFEFLSDRNIATWNNEIAAIYSISIPQGLVKNGDFVSIKYSDDVEYEVNRIRIIMADYIKAKYQDLLGKI